MKWIEPKFSKESVKKAGKAIIEKDEDSLEFKEAIPILHNWRASHAFPMQIMLDLLRKNALCVDKNVLVVQRLKRVRSIFLKLNNEHNMSLSRMEDIGGCRAILAKTEDVYKVYRRLKKSNTKNILFRERDYIKNPKESGYRGIHLVYKYNGSKKEFMGFPVELQIRSKIQHSWATAVEVVGTFTKQALKSSKGDADWLAYFKFASAEFSKLEGYADTSDIFKGIDTYEELKKLALSLEVDTKLRAFNVAIKNLDTKKEDGVGYYILILKLEENLIQIARFNKNQFTEATDYYNAAEEKYKDDISKDLVMVSASSLKALKKAYPNYFSDTIEFSKYIAKVHEINGLHTVIKQKSK